MFLYKICIPKKRAKISSCRNKPRDASLATTTSVLAGEEARATHGKNEKKVSVSVTAVWGRAGRSADSPSLWCRVCVCFRRFVSFTYDVTDFSLGNGVLIFTFRFYFSPPLRSI